MVRDAAGAPRVRGTRDRLVDERTRCYCNRARAGL